MKKEIIKLLESKEGTLKLNNISKLRRFTKNALNEECDILKLDFDTINDVDFGMSNIEIKSRDWKEIIKECECLTEQFLDNAVKERIIKNLKAGYGIKEV